jgi:hypothetical protein
MRRALFVIATASLVAAVLAGPAVAKGLMGSATVNGKGLKKAITFKGDSHDGDGFFEFLGQTGLIGAIDGSNPSNWKKQPPTDDLGPRYTITWDLDQFEGPSVHVVQYLYPYAEDGPLVYTPKSVRIMQSEVPTGWFEAPSVLRSHLESRGLPDTNPNPAPAAAATDTDDAASESAGALPYVLLVGIAVLIVIGFVATRARLRPAKAS